MLDHVLHVVQIQIQQLELPHALATLDTMGLGWSLALYVNQDTTVQVEPLPSYAVL